MSSAAKTQDNLPHVPRSSERLKNDNPPGDYTLAPRCGARTRAGRKCFQPAMRNGRCRFHGGKSTGPKTEEGKEKAAKANYRHGEYSKQAMLGYRQLDSYRSRNRESLKLLLSANSLLREPKSQISVDKVKKINETLKALLDLKNRTDPVIDYDSLSPTQQAVFCKYAQEHEIKITEALLFICRDAVL